MRVREIVGWLLLLTPYLLLIGAYIAVLRGTFGLPRPWSIRVGIVVSLLASCAVIAQGWWHFFLTWSSTAGIGLFFLPFYAALIGVVGYLGGWSSAILLQMCKRNRMAGPRPGMLSTVIAAVTLVILAISGYRVVGRQLLLARAQAPATPGLGSIAQQAMAARDLEVLRLVARNPQIQGWLLEELYAFGERDPIFRELGSPYFSVWSALARNPRTPSDRLALLARRPGGDDEKRTIHYAIAINPNTPSAVLAELADDPDEMVRTWVCSNPHISTEVLLKLRNDTSQRVRDSTEHFLQKRQVQ